MPVSKQEVPVLVIGGSLVGLTTSVLLASHGVQHMLIERHRGTSIHPRAASLHQRTMEVFRSVGLQQAVEDAVLRPRDGGPEGSVRAQYVIAADGVHSFVRGRLGIDMSGRGSFADCVTIYFKADLRALIGDRNLSVVYVNQPELLAFSESRSPETPVSWRFLRRSTRTAPAAAASAKIFPRPVAPHSCAQRSEYRQNSLSRSTTCSPGARPLPRRRHSARGAFSWPVMPRISCPPPAAIELGAVYSSDAVLDEGQIRSAVPVEDPTQSERQAGHARASRCAAAERCRRFHA
jgi:2-polyprenyl-6-methoxyphenol hydroxylase-like FAD-dependent oxidoreductase